MEIKNLFKPKSKTPPPEYFLAIEIHDSLVKTAVWQVENETPSLVNVGSFEAWDSEKSLLNGLDVSLTQAVKNLDIEPDRVIFGLPETWLDNNKVAPSRASLIKKVTKQLSLKPVGLVTITEAVLQQLKTDEGIPPTAILLEAYPTKAVVSLVRLGQIEKQEEVGRSDDLAKDVEEGLVRMKSDKLPVRFILLDGSNLENEEQQIVSYPWQEKLNFLHLPKVETLSNDYSIKAVALSGGTEAAKSLGLEIDAPAPDRSDKSDKIVPSGDDSPESLGFRLEDKKDPEAKIKTPAPSQSKVATKSDQPETKPQKPLSQDQAPQADQTPPPSTQVDPSPSTKFRLPNPLSFLRGLSLSSPFPRPSLPRNIKLIIPLLFLLLVPLSLYAFYNLFARADIVVRVKPQITNQTASIILSDTPQTDQVTVPVTFKNLDISVDESINTTGETVVGEKAVGQVIVYNRSSQARTLKAGSQIETDNHLIYTLDSAVTIASSSAQTEPPFTTTPGNTSASVTASKVGVEHNLKKDTQFSVDNYPKSVLIATAETDFTKGSSRTVKAVGKEDIIQLLELADQKVESESQTLVQTQDPDQHSLIIADPEIIKKEFSHDIGQEAQKVSLDMSVRVSILTYSHLQLNNTLSDQLIAKNQPGLRLLPEETKIKLEDPQKISDNSFSAQANLEGVLVPVIDAHNYQAQLSGKSITQAKQLLETLAGYSGTTIKITPNLPLLNHYLPRQKDNISIDLVTP